MLRFRFAHGLMVLALLLAACGGGGNTGDPAGALPTPEERLLPTLPPAPTWQEAGAAITRANIAQARLLGRLDAAGTPSTVFAHDFSADSTQLIALNNDSLLAWDLITGQLLFTIPRENATQVYASSDKAEIYAIDDLGRVVVYDAVRTSQTTNFQGIDGYSSVSAFQDDGDLLALGALGGEAKVWDVRERTSLVALETGGGDVLALAFAPDGTRLATSNSDGTVQVWDWRARAALGSLSLPEGEQGVRLAFAPDGSQLAIGGLNALFLYDVAGFSEFLTLQTGAGGASDVLAYSPDGRYLINGGLIPNMLVWNPQSGDLVAQLPGIGGDRISAAFSPDGDMLVTSRLDGSVSLWNLAEATESTIPNAGFDTGSARILYVNWSADGFVLAFFDAIGPVYVWGIAPQE